MFANKTFHFVASWYRPPESKVDEFVLLKKQLENVKTLHTGNKPPSVHVLGDFNFRDWPDRLNKQGSSLSMSEGAMLEELISDHELEQVVQFPTRGQNTLDLIITSLPRQFVDIHSPTGLVIMTLSLEL